MSQPAGKAVIQVLNASGPVSGATAEYYVTGTTTPAAVYADNTLNTSLGAVLNGGNASNSLGYFPVHWLDPQVSYKRVVKDSLGAQITSLCVDPVQIAETGTSSAQSIATIAALQAKTWGSATVPNILLVISNSSPGDGGGIFRYDSSDTTTADNGTTIIIDGDGHRWKRQTQEELYSLAVTNGWYLPSANTPTLRANSTTVASATGTGGLILADVTTPISAYAVGPRGTILVSKDIDYTFVAADQGKMYRHDSGSGHAWTIPPVSSVAWPIGAMIRVRNIGAGTVTLTRGASVVQRMAGVSTDQNVALAQWGDAVLTMEASDVWVVSGTNIS